MNTKLYTAHCVENGERFVVYFRSDKKKPSDLMEQGRTLAIEWGGECTSVRAWKPDYFVTLTSKKTGKAIRTTVKAWDAWMKKHLEPNVCNWSPECPYIVKPDGETPEPTDVWDFTKTNAENTARVNS